MPSVGGGPWLAHSTLPHWPIRGILCCGVLYAGRIQGMYFIYSSLTSDSVCVWGGGGENK